MMMENDDGMSLFLAHDQDFQRNITNTVVSISREQGSINVLKQVLFLRFSKLPERW